MSRPVHIAGRGAVSAYGMGVEALADGMLSGVRGVRERDRTTSFEAPTGVAAEFPRELFPDDYEICKGGERRTGELSRRAALAAAHEALREGGVDPDERGALSETGLVIATTKADLAGIVGEGAGYGSPARLATRLADDLGLGGERSAVSTACASGLTAIAMGARRIAAGEIDRVLVIGVDVINEFIMAGFGSMRILDPVPCRPFDMTRVGISLGDGAGAMLLTANEADSIGARVSGHGGANDAVSVTGCHREGLGVTLATQRALSSAGLSPDAVDLVHLHGTGTKASDFSEATGLGVTFSGETPPAVGTKGLTGHTLGAAGVLESLIALSCLERKRVPANAGLVEPNVDARLSLTREPERLDRARCALKVSGGFGGIQQAIVLEI